MSKFSFTTDEDIEDYCDEIVSVMVNNFHISEVEAIRRINAHWKEHEANSISGITHEWPMYWAYNIYYEPHEQWWIRGQERENLNLSPLKIKPFANE